MNIKKVFASLTGVLMLATTVTPLVTGAASYGAELEGAYKYAFEKGITTMTSIDSANMYGEITRGQLAKMISNWAEAELGQKADATKVCSFTDEGTAEGDLAMYLKKSCQMGLMGQGIVEFRPNAKVTRGEFGTTLSRALWGDKYNTTANPYYVNHLQALKDAGIMTRIETPNQVEIRGYVMLMLQRAVAKKDAANCADPVIALACSLGQETCPAACKKTTEENNNSFSGAKAGDLSIALNSTNAIVSIPNDGVVKVAELSLNASQDIQLHALDVTRLGLSNNDGLKVWIEKDGRRISSSSSFFGDSKANLVFNGGYVVKKGDKLDLVISLDKDKVLAGSELSFRVSNVASSAQNTVVSPDTTGVFRTTNYSVTALKFLPLTNTDRSYNISKDAVFSFGEFKLQNESSASMEKNVLVKSVTFKVNGADIANLKNFKLLRNGKELNSTYTANGREVTIVINDQIDSGKSAVYKVVATPFNIEQADGDKYSFEIRRSEDIVAEEIGQNAVGYRVAIKDLNVVDMKSTTVKGGTITLARDANFPTVVNADWGYSDVTVAKGTMKLTQATKFEDGIVLNRKAGTATDLSKVVRRASIIIGGRTYQATTIAADKIEFVSEVYLDKGTHNVEVQVSLVSTKDAAITNFELDNVSKESFKKGAYLNSEETKFDASHMVGTLRVAKVNVQEQKMSFKKTGPSEDVRLVAGNTDERVVFVGEVTNGSNRTLELSQFVIKADSVVAAVAADKKLADVSLHLADGSTSSTVAVNNNADTYTIDSITTTLEAGKSLKFELRAINNADLVANDSYRFKVSAKGTLEGNTVTTTELNSVYVRVTGAATTNVVGNTSAKNLIVLPGTSTEIASFNYNVKNDSVDLDKVVFTTAGVNAGDLDDLTLQFGDITPSIDSVVVDANKVTVKFANLVTLPAKNYAVKVFANFSEAAIAKNATVGTAEAQTKKEFTKVELFQDAVAKGAGDIKYGHYVAKAFPILAVKEKNTNTGNERLDVNVTKNTEDYKVVLKSINANPGQFVKVSGAAGNFEDVELSQATAEVARSTVAKTAVQTVSFEVTDDEGNVAGYADVDASNIADFAGLSL